MSLISAWKADKETPEVSNPDHNPKAVARLDADKCDLGYINLKQLTEKGRSQVQAAKTIDDLEPKPDQPKRDEAYLPAFICLLWPAPHFSWV